MVKQTFTVKGMHCKSCEILINDNLEELGASNIKIKVDIQKQIGVVNCDSDLPRGKLAAAITKEGYKTS
ncbi:MAG: heavy metal-associated domain-containing protein [Nanoarchaeota archaeon]